MKSFTLAHFVKTATTPEEPKSRLDLVPFVVFNKFVAKHLSDVDKLCVHLATSRDQRSVSKKELEDAAKCDDDCNQEDQWYDDNDEEYDDDFVAQWDESEHSDDEFVIDNERDKW